MNSNNIFRSSSPVISTLVYIFVATVLFGTLLYIAFRIVSYSRRPVNAAVATYEPFAPSGGYAFEVEKRLTSIRALKQKLSEAFESISRIADDTCSILHEVEQGYVSDRAAPSDAAEYELPQEIQTERVNARKARAKQMFVRAQTMYAQSKDKPIFACGGTTVEGFADTKEQELQTELDELIQLMESAELRMADQHTVELDTLLGFTEKYLSGAITQVTAEAFESGGVSELAGGDLLAKADLYIGKGLTLYDRIAALDKRLKTQQEMSRQLTAHVTRLERGDVREGDVLAGLGA